MMLLGLITAQAQIKIGGNIYGGGNAGDMSGNTSVTVRAGDIHGGVYGGARQANVGGHAFVNIDGEHMSDDIVINYVYGGNDIAGKIGESIKVTDPIPAGLTDAVANGITPAEGETNAGNNTKQYGAFVLTTKERTAGTAETQRHIFIGQLFGGGNGDYDYESAGSPYLGMIKPELSKTYLELRGGTIAYAYGGGNNATVTVATDICVDNSSSVTTDAHLKTILNINDAGLKERVKEMGLNTVSTQVSSDAFQFARVFGGNNKAEMAIRPTWHLESGAIRNLYSGGNQGAMIHDNGILLAISPTNPAALRIENVFGGCRMADVNPGNVKLPIQAETIDGADYPAGYSARVLIEGGDINNVYGGNDISGNIYGGNAVGIHSSIKGDVYGGGNGSYAYTDNEQLGQMEAYKDFYYNVNKILGKAEDSDFTGLESVQALNRFRPNAESVSIRVVGTENKKTVIGGAIYCGGNSATLRSDDSNKHATSQLKIGSYVVADKVFLGNNGANMVTEDILKKYAGDETVKVSENNVKTYDFSQMELASERKDADDQTQFDKYMDGCAMMIEPDVTFDPGYLPYSTYFGSFYCGGNVGSMKKKGVFNVSFNDKVVVFDKVVGGSNEANVYEKTATINDVPTKLNAQYLGGLIGDAEEGTGNKLILNFGGLKIQPKRWKIKRNDDYTPDLDSDGNEQYDLDDDGNRQLEWNTVDGRTYDPDTKKYTPMAAVSKGGDTAYDPDTDLNRRFHGGNIYGGCYSNGHVNGNVVINLNASLVDRKGENAIFDEIEENEGEAKLYDGNYNIKKRYTGVLLGEQGMDVLGRALNVFGGGYGGDSEIWGSTTINLNKGYTFQIFGGGEQGAIGKAESHAPDPTNPNIHNLVYTYNKKYSTCINLNDKDGYTGTYRGDDDDSDHVVDHDDMAEAEFIYGGSFEGPIAGNTCINLGNGRIFNSFAGSCNADILGHTETYVGRNSNNDNDLGFPWIRDHIYGGNDLGGQILGEKGGSTDAEIAAKADCDFTSRVRAEAKPFVYKYNATSNPKPEVLQASAYTEYIQGRVEYIFGGCYGSYDYKDSHYKNYTYTAGEANIPDGFAAGLPRKNSGFTKPRLGNAFVNIRPIANNNASNGIKKIFGAGQGYRGEIGKDSMQMRSYVLIDIPASMTAFQNTEVLGAGSFGGLGFGVSKATAKADLDAVTAVIDLVRGKISNVYGGSWNEGMTRRTLINVPAAPAGSPDGTKGSTADVANIFGGAFGSNPLVPCDVYEAIVNYHSEDATVRGNIYGGNNNADRTLYGQVNVSVPVWQNRVDGYLARVYGAGYGVDTWSQYTEVNLTDRAKVYEVYGGGENGQVLNLETLGKWAEKEAAAGKNLDLTIGADYVDYGLNFPENDQVDAYLVKPNGLGTKTNTNVYINKGTYVEGYAYGGGRGADATVSGTTYIGLHGGTVNKDLYAAGWGGAVYDKYKVAKDDDDANDCVATTNAYIEGGTLRNVYGGGYEGAVGYHDDSTTDTAGDILGVSNVTIGIRKDQVFPDDYPYDEAVDSLNYYKGVPAIQRNAYGAGEGGAVYGTANLTINNGYIGYYYDGIKQRTIKVKNEQNEEVDQTVDYEAYEPQLDDNSWYIVSERKNRLKDCGNAFGGGYDDKSLVDFTNVTLWGGVIRSSMYGGGEIATVGRGKTKFLTGLDRGLEDIYKPGKTKIEMYNGHVKRNVFGGGKGYNILGYGGTHELYTDGYVFGQTEVYIHGGEIGTVEGVTVQSDGTGGYGNVFGGGDIGYVYGRGYFNSASRKEGTTSPKHTYYYEGNENEYICTTAYDSYTKGQKISKEAYEALTSGKENWSKNLSLTEDCKVVISPYLQVKDPAGLEINGHTHPQYDYVETDDLNTLPKKNATTKLFDGDWLKLFTGDKNADGSVKTDDPVERGILIHNAVFAGGNVTSNSETYANAPTVFGNTTATLYDVYHRDFITVGTEHVGGLYGGGNLSVVDGYRELNITNYGTDYYGQDDRITLEEYRKLSNRERAYFKLQYVCMTSYTVGDKEYSVGDMISEDDYLHTIDSNHQNKTYWDEFGFCSIYAGRLLNTIQRADFCGVYGSRMVLQGAKDRVSDVASTSEYTINRVGELSLNKQRSVRTSDTGDDALHGNYFGIYNVVNYLGNLTSDVHFEDPLKTVRVDEHGNEVVDTHTDYTYYTWKTSRLEKKDRNNGTSENQVALASGVFMELTTENSTPSKKDYGYITGIVELDLINVKKDIEGGGYVYAKNEHGVRTYHDDYNNVLLSEYNMEKKVSGIELRDEARTYKRYTYYQYDKNNTSSNATNILNHQTSGNFIHKRKRIVDDCYPNNGIYNDGYVESPAHYWYIKGEVYIYDQIVSAYAGSASAYSKEVKIPLTITAASNGRLQLLNVQPSLYAYFADDTKNEENKITNEGVKVDNERTTLHLNDVVNWWDWHQLSDNEQKLFVKETYVNIDTCYVGSYTEANMYPSGTYVLENDKSIHGNNANATAYKQFLNNHPKVYDKKGNEIADISDLFHSSNNISHENGYVLTFDMDSPKDWDDWYSPTTDNSTYDVSGETVTTNRQRVDAFDPDSDNYNDELDKKDYIEGPTFKLNGGNGLYGQRYYELGDVLSKEVYTDYETTVSTMDSKPTGQAIVKPAYVALDDYSVNGTTVVAGNPISQLEYNSLSTDAEKAHFAEALLCTNTIQIGEKDYILRGDLVAKSQLTTVRDQFMTYNNGLQNTDKLTQEEALAYVSDCLTDAYICTTDGKYGGQYFKGGINYSALKAWCSLPGERDLFSYNYDAFDVLVDSNYPGENSTSVYDGVGKVENTTQSLYSASKPVEYVAVYTGDLSNGKTFTYLDEDGTSHTIRNDAQRSVTRADFEKIMNEQRHYTRVNVAAGGQTVYIVQQNFIDGGTPYAKGQDLSQKDYDALSNSVKNDESMVKPIQFENTDTSNPITVYYCYEAYGEVPVGKTINSETFASLNNFQKSFVIQGKEPTQTSTLYVSRESNAKDVTSEKIITVVYQYTYYEPDDEGEGVSMSNELHVVNIHLQLESGAPEVGPLATPPTVLPGHKVGLKAPYVNPGLYEVITNGWEIYTDEQDALHHRNGKPFYNNITKLYWYENQKRWVTFYSKTYLGKTYSNPVLMSVANYHDIDSVMNDKVHHLYVDHPEVKRNSKIYIDNGMCKSDPDKSELDLFKDFFDLSLITEETDGMTFDMDGAISNADHKLKGHTLLNSRVKGGDNLEFILSGDVSPKKYAATTALPAGTGWTPVGDDSQCFMGNFHGDGYTVSGIDHSLFGKLCGSVYNLGVVGPFTTAGVADTGEGYVENCWVKSTATTGFTGNVKAVFNEPEDDGKVHVVNCYYPVAPLVKETPGDANSKLIALTPYYQAEGPAICMDSTAFYNGNVAYNLNGFYLNKRYYDGIGQTSGTEYHYFKPEANGDLTDLISHYPDYTSEIAKYGDIGYVERRFKDGDFRYAAGTIPETLDMRQRTVTTTTTAGTSTEVSYYPIWPDDYIYFGQMLTYGHDGYDENFLSGHEDLPSHIKKSNGRLLQNAESNRVYRAPAYFQNSTMDMAHFNPIAYLAAYSAAKTPTDRDLTPAYPNMTAIDFAGYNDADYKQGLNGRLFYQPLLDDDGLISVANIGETPNLLVYAPSETANEKTYNVLNSYFIDPVYNDYDEPKGGETSDYYTDNMAYGRVAIANSSSVHGHLVQSGQIATNDHLLVDKYDFWCPIPYDFDNTHRMWYQRKPDKYVDIEWSDDETPVRSTKGWEGISIPFEAKTVTTDQKGEITHFYGGSTIGHEYWLRGFTGIDADKSTSILKVAKMTYPDAIIGDGVPSKTVDNTFLWDYYYSYNGYDDKNRDDYQEDEDNGNRNYYQSSRTYSGYPHLAAATPYIIGFPGERYYEFDLSGKFSPMNTASWPSSRDLKQQTITFVSATGIHITNSDIVTDVSEDNYIFKPNYLGKAVTDVFMLNDDGNMYKQQTTAKAAIPFRPFFTGTNGTGETRGIIFGNVQSELKGVEEHGNPTKEELSGGLRIWTKKDKIFVESSLSFTEDVRVVTAAGITVASFSVKSGQTVEVQADFSGMYIVHTLDGKYTKKVSVRK